MSSIRRAALVCLVTVLVTPLLLASVGAAHARSTVPRGGAEWDAHVKALIEAYYAATPSAGVGAGRHEYDGRLPDFSPAGLSAYDTLLTNWRSRTVAFDTTTLDADRRFEREYVVAILDQMLWSLKSVDAPHRNPAFYAGALDPDVYLTRPYAPLRQRMQAYIRYARSVVHAAPEIQGNLRLPLARTMIDRGRGAFGGFASFFKKNVPAVFASVNDPALQRELTQVNDSAAAAMRSLDAWFEAQRSTQTEDFAIGAGRFREMLYATERVDTPLDELERIGRADLARNQNALRTECARYAPGASVAECVRKADAHKPPENTLDAARRQLKMLRQYVADHGVVAIPGTEEARVGESPPYMRYNTAYIQIPGPYDLTLPSTYYVAPPDPSWTPEQPAVHLRARGVARPLSAVPPRQAHALTVWPHVQDERLLRGVGPLRRGDDVGRGARRW
jgi:hypothetical protein